MTNTAIPSGPRARIHHALWGGPRRCTVRSLRRPVSSFVSRVREVCHYRLRTMLCARGAVASVVLQALCRRCFVSSVSTVQALRRGAPTCGRCSDGLRPCSLRGYDSRSDARPCARCRAGFGKSTKGRPSAHLWRVRQRRCGRAVWLEQLYRSIPSVVHHTHCGSQWRSSCRRSLSREGWTSLARILPRTPCFFLRCPRVSVDCRYIRAGTGTSELRRWGRDWYRRLRRDCSRIFDGGRRRRW